MTVLDIENMKCCGNCVHRESMNMGDYSSEVCTKNKNTVSWEYCPKWEKDGRTKENRIIDL